jgi:hypothetical protein
MGQAAKELDAVLSAVRLPVDELVRGGGGEGKLTQRIRRALAQDFGWAKHSFEVKKIVDGREKESISHEIDHVKCFGDHAFALEIEWNNKDPFFDRDLENFKRLHADGAISIGAIITRGQSLHEGMRELVEKFAAQRQINSLEDLQEYYVPTSRQVELIREREKRLGGFGAGWAHAFVADKFGEATTHWRKLMERVRRGVGNPCPLLLIGIPRDVVTMEATEGP